MRPMEMVQAVLVPLHHLQPMMMMMMMMLMMMMSYYESPYPLQPNYKYLSGLAILPSIAEAAAVAGDER